MAGGMRCAILFLLLSFTCVNSWIFEFENFILQPGSIFEQSSVMYAPGTLEWNFIAHPGNGNSFVEANLQLAGPYNTLGVYLFHSSDRSIQPACCTPEWKLAGNCTEVGQLQFFNVDPKSLPYRIKVNQDNSMVQSFAQKFVIQSTGTYHLKLYNCASDQKLNISGELVWMNPFGHLRGNLFPFLPYYLTLAALYMLIGVTWIFLTAIHWEEILQLQHCIAGVIFLGMVENMLTYSTYFHSNWKGRYHIGIALMAILASTAKKTISRVLVLMVSLGYGFVKPTLGTTMHKITLLGALYFIFSAILEIMDMLQKHDSLNITSSFSFLMLLPVAFLDTAFFWFIYTSLYTTMAQLTQRKQTLKLSLYRAFFGILVICLILSLLILGLGMLFVFTIPSDDRYKVEWITTVCWSLLYFVVLLSMVIIWRPTTNNTRYAYSELDDAESLSSVFTSDKEKDSEPVSVPFPNILEVDPDLQPEGKIE